MCIYSKSSGNEKVQEKKGVAEFTGNSIHRGSQKRYSQLGELKLNSAGCYEEIIVQLFCKGIETGRTRYTACGSETEEIKEQFGLLLGLL